MPILKNIGIIRMKAALNVLYSCFWLVFASSNSVVFGQTIFTAPSTGSQFATYRDLEKGYVLGGFDGEFNGQMAIGGRDLFFSSEDHKERISGFGVEQWIFASKWAEKSVGIVRYFGSLSNESQQLTSRERNSFAIMKFDEFGSSITGDLKGNALSISVGEPLEEYLPLVFLTSDTIYYNDQIFWSSTRSTLLLTELDVQGTLHLRKAIPYSGDLNIHRIKPYSDLWSLQGDFKHNLTLADTSFSTETSFTDGILIQWKPNSDHLEYILATGVFDVRFIDMIKEGEDEYYLGAYNREVNINSTSIQAPQLKNNGFIYHRNASKLLDIGGIGDDIPLRMGMNQKGIQIGGYCSEDFRVATFEATCNGAICTFILSLNKEITPTELIVDDSENLLLPYSFQICPDKIQYCGEYQGQFNGNVSEDTDWICVLRDLGTSSNQESSLLFQLYPNPASASIYVKKPPSVRIQDYQLFDLFGKIHPISFSQGKFEINHLPNGQYYLQLIHDNYLKVLTFSKF